MWPPPQHAWPPTSFSHVTDQVAGFASERLLRHGLFGDPEHVVEQVAGLTAARLLRHGLFGDPEHVTDQVAGLASARLFYGTVYLEILNMS